MFILDAPAGKLALPVVGDGLLFREAHEFYADGPDYVAQLEGLIEGQQGQVLIILLCPSLVATNNNLKIYVYFYRGIIYGTHGAISIKVTLRIWSSGVVSL